MTGVATVETVSDIRSLERLAPEWERLLAASRCNRAFSSPAWFFGWCRQPSVRPRVLVAWRGEALAGVLPLVLLQGKLRFGDFSDYNDAVVACGDTAAAVALLRAALRCGEGELHLVRVRPDANLASAVRTLDPARRDQSLFLAGGRVSCPWVDVSRGYDDFLAGRTRKFRSNLRRAERRARERRLRIVELEPESFPPRHLPELFLTLHTSRFPHSSRKDPVRRAFDAGVLPTLFRQRHLEVFALLDGETVLGVDLCTVGARSLGIWNGGFLSTAADYSPGTLLDHAALRAACSRGLDELDFMRGDEPYKARWCTGSRTIGSLRLTGLDAGEAR